MDSLGVLLVAPMNAYLEQELDRRCRLFRLWESPADRRDDYLRAHASSIRAVVPYALQGFSGKRVGILGLGRIGLAVAKRAEAFDCPISYHSRSEKPFPKYKFYPNVVDLAANCDVLVVACSLNPETRHIVNRKVIDALGPEGVLINIARGAHVDEPELISALLEKRLGGAGLDVFEDEPFAPEQLFELDNVVLVPHVGSDTEETCWAMADLFSGKRVGIIGLGRIGLAVAKRVEAFDCPVNYYQRTKQDHPGYTYYPSVVELAASSDVLVVACPLNEHTRHIVNREVMEALGPRGVLINIGRGPHVDEAAMVAALADGRLGGAGLDVFEDEPNVPEALLGMDNVVLVPHVGSATHETRTAMADLVLGNLEAHVAGKPLLTQVV
ncbi:hypothetical protein OsJ_00971 [Oryza sativa Japonica Group]|uniref:D-isomer specific 2-hydroxyacid dehydrogenase NAD-binding domain-containing protein n=1 Tax=Oryza sativa subsp. japonica TaxID=39947 RepID=B9EUH0_ORYSJ|nr:hypothetical protein OsJ_00971 [Oryza sativa Japonica Group]